MGSNGDFSVPQKELSLTEQWQLRLSESALVDPTTLLAEYPEAGIPEILDVVLMDQHAKWQTEPGPRVEEYLQRLPQLAGNDDALLDLAYGEVRARRKLGFAVRPEHLMVRFPQVAEELQKQLHVAGWLDDNSNMVELADTASNVRPAPLADVGASEDLPDGQTDFGEYRLIERIGRGGMGVIYRAQHRRFDRTVAIKMLSIDRPSGSEEFQRFQNEIFAVARFDHPNILPIYEVGECDGTPFFTTRLIERGSLADNHQSFQNQPETVARLAAAMARAVHHAHQRGVLHRDLKPSNVLIDDHNQPLIADFGLAQLLHGSSELTRTGEFVGTAAWMAPERAVLKPGTATTAVDVYGVGAILYFLLTGRAPFAGESLLETLMLVREGSVVSPRKLVPAIDRDLEMVCLMAMDRDPSRRYATAEELAKDLDRYIQGEPVIARPLPQYAQWARRMKRHPVVTAIVSTVLLATAVLLGMGTFYTLQQARLTDTLVQKTAEAKIFSESTARLRTEAEVIRDEALTARRDHRELLYAAHIREAGNALGAGDFRQADALLHQELPQADSEDMRGFEWFWLRRQCSIGPPHREIAFHNPRCLEFSSDGRWLAVGDSAGVCHVLDAKTYAIAGSWKTPHDMVESVSFSPSSNCLATAGDANSICVWDHVSAELISSLSVAGGTSWRTTFIDDTRLVAWQREHDAILWEFRTSSHAEPIRTEVTKLQMVGASTTAGFFALVGPERAEIYRADSLERVSAVTLIPADTDLLPTTRLGNGGRAIQFSASGRYLAIESHKQILNVYTIGDTGLAHKKWTWEILDEIRGIAFSADESHALVCTATGSVVSWKLDSATGTDAHEPVVAWPAHTDRANAIACSYHGDVAVTLGRDHRLRVWHASGAPEPRLLSEATDPPLWSANVAASNPDWLLAPAVNGVHRWKLQTSPRLDVIDPFSMRRDSVAVSPDSRLVAVASWNESSFLEVWQLHDDKKANHPLWRQNQIFTKSLSFSPDSRWLAVVDQQNDQLLVLDAKTGNELKNLPCESGKSVAFSPNGRQLAASVLDAADVWDCDTWRPLFHLPSHSSSANVVVYSPDSRWIATGSNDRSIIISHAETGVEYRRLLGHRNDVKDIVFAADGRSLVSASLDGTIKVWHVVTGEYLCDLYTSQVRHPVFMTFCNSGRELAVRLEDGEIILLNCDRVQNGEEDRR